MLRNCVPCVQHVQMYIHIQYYYNEYNTEYYVFQVPIIIICSDKLGWPDNVQ